MPATPTQLGLIIVASAIVLLLVVLIICRFRRASSEMLPTKQVQLPGQADAAQGPTELESAVIQDVNEATTTTISSETIKWLVEREQATAGEAEW